ncbi:plasmid mobilization protein [Holdemanella biformis]|uniref:plasmid mobilization protein n=1 Tax=Holdemanella biformis TaxID=1735 RepID=UPI003AB7FBBC
MPGLKKNRKRPNTIAFHVSDEEKIAIETRINVAGLPKSEFYIASCLEKKLDVIGGKFGSDRLSVQIENMNVFLRNAENIYNKNQKIIEDYTEEIGAITKRLNELNEAVIEIQKENLELQKVILESRYFNEELLQLMKEKK